MGKLPTCSEYVAAIETPQLLKASILKNGHVVKRNETVIRYVGGFCVVFPYQTPKRKYAIRCWYANVGDAQERTHRIAQELSKIHLPYFVGFDYIPDGIVTNEGLQPIVAMDWVEAYPLKEYIQLHITESGQLQLLANNFLLMVKDLHKYKLSHGDLQHGNILVKDNGSIVLVDYDSMYVPALEGFSDEIKGLEGYQHESRSANEKLTPKADYFSELVIYTSLKTLAQMPQLWDDLNMENTETLLFSNNDIKSKGKSEIFRILETNEELAFLSHALKDFMQCASIEELLPLEEVLKSPIDSISTKWVDSGYCPPSVVDYSASISNISNSWNVSTAINGNIPNTESITKKW